MIDLAAWFPNFSLPWWGIALTVLEITVTLFALKHVLLYKRDSRAAAGWAAVIVLSPLFGALFYFILGINRTRRRAKSLRPLTASPPPDSATNLAPQPSGEAPEAWRCLATLVERVSREPLQNGNQLTPLFHGADTYPAMLAAIAQAKHSIGLSTYIFNKDAVGLKFAQALSEAVNRAVEVRVLIDDVGTRYSRPAMLPHLRRLKIPVATFHPTSMVLLKPSSNLRNHRKILLVDGEHGFTGGMNLSASNVEDTHLAIRGPLLASLHRTFLSDWHFATGEHLVAERWPLVTRAAGKTLARAIVSGPDEDFGKTRTVLMGALTAAQQSVVIMTPYFLPDASLISHLSIAALRGVQVDIILPAKSNIPLIDWACAAFLWQLLENGCRIWRSPGPFQHGKVMVVDHQWVLMGSSNWDARSLRLNFELDVECYDAAIAKTMLAFLQHEISLAHQLTLQELDGRPTWMRLRDGTARLLTPFL